MLLFVLYKDEHAYNVCAVVIFESNIVKSFLNEVCKEVKF